MISWEDFEKIDIRTGTIIDVQDFPKARKPSYQLTIDFGPLGIKRSSAQVTHHYSKEALLNKQIVAVVNFPVKQIATFFKIDEKLLMKELLSDQFAYRIIEEEADLDTLKVAEEKVEYLKKHKPS